MNAESPDTFVAFTKSNPALAENKIIAFLSSERTRADHGEISARAWYDYIISKNLLPLMNEVNDISIKLK